jgi:hypothetical protein
MATRMARGATVQLPMGQIAALGLGCFAIMNPEKFFQAVSQTMRALNGAQTNNGSLVPAGQQPIIIHQAPTVAGPQGSRLLMNLLAGAGLCWGSYMVLINILPDYFKQMLPVTAGRFNQAIRLLGKSIMDLKDSLMEEIFMLGKKQDDLGKQQEETHEQVVDINGKVTLLKDDITLMQDTLKACEATLLEQERRSIHTARGVKLLTQSVSTFLPEDDNLLHELNSYNNTSAELHNKPSPLKVQKGRNAQHIGISSSRPALTAPRPSSPTVSEKSVDPESEIPERATPITSKVEHSVEDVRNLLRQYGVNVQ